MNDELQAELVVPFSCVEHAQIAYNTLNVDSEPRKDLITKVLSIEQSEIRVVWTASEARILRVSLNSFPDHLNSVVETIQQFSDY